MAGIDAFNAKFGPSIIDALNNGNTDGDTVDTKGYAFALGVAAVAATTGNLDVIKVQESDDNSAWVDVSGLSFTALGATDDDKHVLARIDLRGRRRYLRWHISEDATGTADVAAFFMLGGAEESPVSTTTSGAAEILTA